MPLPQEHPFDLTERDIRRSITRLEHYRDNLADETEKRIISTVLNHLREAYEHVMSHPKAD